MNDLEDVVRVLAYRLWENAGRPQGRSKEFWLSAEAEIKRAQSQAPADGSQTDAPAPPQADEAEAAPGKPSS